MFVSVSRGISGVTLNRRNEENRVPWFLGKHEKRKTSKVENIALLRGGTAWWILGYASVKFSRAGIFM